LVTAGYLLRLVNIHRQLILRAEGSHNMAKLDGKVAVITGASSGIGEATAEALAAERAVVVVAARREERLENLVERINGDGGKALAVACDVTEEEQAHSLIRRAKEEFGQVDILVNNAGVMQLSEVEKGLSDEWRTMFEVNVLGLLYATEAAIEVMKEQGSGHLINISSLASRGTRPGLGVYSGTKMAVNGISEALRQELLEDNIRVTMVEPGAVETELPEHITDEEAREGLNTMLEQLDPLKAEDIANAIVYAVTQPQRVSINEILIRPTQQPN
jgi:NADP-dependent 3-hydroxy acid dehydrogenase YdfG